MRVTVNHAPRTGSEPPADQIPYYHQRAGERCGPVEIEHPFQAPDDPILSWKVG